MQCFSIERSMDIYISDNIVQTIFIYMNNKSTKQIVLMPFFKIQKRAIKTILHNEIKN